MIESGNASWQKKNREQKSPSREDFGQHHLTSLRLGHGWSGLTRRTRGGWYIGGWKIKTANESASDCNNSADSVNLLANGTSMSHDGTSGISPQVFPPTRWTVVLAACQRASPESSAALEAICHAYWYPLYAYVRRAGQSPHDAQDLTQEFFCRLLEKRWLDAANPDKGRLRTFLIVALKHFMAN